MTLPPLGISISFPLAKLQLRTCPATAGVVNPVTVAPPVTEKLALPVTNVRPALSVSVMAASNAAELSTPFAAVIVKVYRCTAGNGEITLVPVTTVLVTVTNGSTTTTIPVGGVETVAIPPVAPLR